MRRILKRLIDIGFALIGLVLLSPLMAAAAIAIRVTMGGPVVFRQVRPGYLERPITVFKFRTMLDKAGADGNQLPDALRLTPIGAFLRRASLDELPQLYNVLRGDLSLVGPRPLLTRYGPYYTPRERLRFTVPPGVTGWAQVHGRNLLSWDHRLEYDAWYVENWSLWLDVKILGLTVLKVLGHQGVVVDTQRIMKDLDQERSAGVREL